MSRKLFKKKQTFLEEWLTDDGSYREIFTKIPHIQVDGTVTKFILRSR